MAKNDNQLGIDKLTAADMREGTAVVLMKIDGQMYAQGIEGMSIKNDRDLYNALIIVGNLVGNCRRTLYYGAANREGQDLTEFMDSIKPEEDRVNGL